ncbi:hypothetical protein KP509_10G041400 [Ceratopteris richardii]|uniref:tryptophan synthase n=1 Tax=Ceratopteris richardii TaxID=49495 RepID=A0A8T2TYL5_CERRI|nr:hypothetical protein KP509_10G041400 [Ceratopteris richardii]
MENILGSRSSLFAQFISFCPRCARTARSPAFRMSMTLADTQKSITTTISVSEITDYLPPSFSTVQPHVLSTPRKLGVSQKSIAQTFSLLRAQGKVAFIPYVTAGDPSLSVTAQALRVLNDSGADIIELGLPHSNPSLDGPVIQASVARSLQNGCDWESVLGMLKKVTPNIEAPIVLFTYYKPILKKGIENFVQAVRSAGVTGLLIPDLPPEEIHKARILTELCGLELVLLTTPTTSKQQMNYISQVSQGFIYLSERSNRTELHHSTSS